MSSARHYWKTAWRAARCYAWGSLSTHRQSVARFAIDAMDARKREMMPFMRRVQLGMAKGNRRYFLTGRARA